MKKIELNTNETFYVAGKSIDDARERMSLYGAEGKSTPQDAWDALGYWDREDYPDQFEVFEFRVTEKITQVETPYSA